MDHFQYELFFVKITQNTIFQYWKILLIYPYI